MAPGRPPIRQRADGISQPQPFTAKLDAALQERGSPARCWAHCRQGNQIFHWGDNSWRDNDWITRTRAASALANYVAKLLNEGWQCHIIAHSHGGNIVLEALPEIMAVPNANRSLGKIVTLGTPFMDMMSPIHERVYLQDKVMKIPPLSAAACVIFVLFIALTGRWQACKNWFYVVALFLLLPAWWVSTQESPHGQ